MSRTHPGVRQVLSASLVFSCLLLATNGLAEDDQPKEKPAASAEASDDSPAWDIWLRADEKYRLRAVVSPGDGGAVLDPGPDDETDHDISLFLSGGVRSPCDKLGADLALGLWWDADSTVAQGDPTGVGAQTDYRGLWWDVFTLAADYRTQGAVKKIRLGRQTSNHGLPVVFDGLAADFRALGSTLELFAFGGRTTHFFEPLQDSMFEDWIGSAGVVVRPTSYMRLELDYRFMMEDVLDDTRAAKEDLLDHSYGLTAWFRHADWLLARLRVRGINSEVSHAGLGAQLTHPGWQAGLDVEAEAQLATLDELNESQDPFHILLGESLAHMRYRLELWKLFLLDSGRYGLHLGFDGRNLLKGEEGAFNHNLGRAYFMVNVDDFLVPGLFASASVEGHYSYEDNQLSGDMFLTAGGSAGYKGELIRAELGTYYHRVKYDYFGDVREINDVRTYFGSFGVKLADVLGIKVRYEYEQFDRDVHTVIVALSQSL